MAPLFLSEACRNSIREVWNRVWTRQALMGLLLGQFVSLLITSTGFSSSELARRDKLVLLSDACYCRCGSQFHCLGYYCSLTVKLDSLTSFFFVVVLSYQYTSLTSVMLLDCWSIPCVILFTWLFLGTKYGFRKFAGVAICVAGLVMVVFSDVHASDRAQGGPNPVKGDLLVFAGSTLYAVSNVSEEFIIKRSTRIELMAMLGAFGAVVSAIQIAILERNELQNVNWTAGAVLPFLGFALAMFLFYSTVPIILKICGATMLNLSLLTSDMWAVLIRICAYHQKVDWMYFIAFAGVTIGLMVYSWSREDKSSEVAKDNEAAGDCNVNLNNC
ncbi:hypothetical protein ZIOFF_015624 [Zingiber officinale]|uniref:Solute carrier family 35 member F1 n=1 Tax=Zingiber officinale TaxID=94328 RepID=A0A8J5LFG3_ZINOF|nr:hypothetical protein ZIOFF_015624 [Zingiber officinale]